MMRKRTQDIRLAELIRDVTNHKHRDELLKLMNEQLLDDTCLAKS